MKIPESQHTTRAAIFQWHESQPQEHRQHMGASIIGHDCPRYIWNTFRWVAKPAFEGRMLRLFRRGQREEAEFVEELRAIGATVWEVDPSTGKQFTVSACDGHFGGSVDGVVQGVPEAPRTPAVLEFKTHNHKSFTALVKNGVKGAKPQHYDQMQVYMGLMQLDRALYLAVDKDTDELHSEWVHADKVYFSHLMEKAQSLIDATEPPARMSDDPAYWQCKFCSFNANCHGAIAAEANCRTCCHSTPISEGKWRCESKSKELDNKSQEAGCSLHLMIPMLVPHSEPIDGGEGWIQYRHKESGAEWINGSHGDSELPKFSSRELQKTPSVLMPQVAETKEEFPKAIVTSGIATAFDDIATHPDDIKVKSETKQQKEERRKIKKATKEMKILHEQT